MYLISDPGIVNAGIIEKIETIIEEKAEQIKKFSGVEFEPSIITQKIIVKMI